VKPTLNFRKNFQGMSRARNEAQSYLKHFWRGEYFVAHFTTLPVPNPGSGQTL
jgi:hypothetical protein